MTSQWNSVNVGGNVGGNVVAGNNNVVGAQPGAGPDPAAETGLTPRLGFLLDVVGYGQRPAHLKSDIHTRLAELVTHLRAELGATTAETRTDGGSGDGMAVFLPVGTDYTRALPRLLTAAASWLARDNDRFRDRMRLRMAIGTGLLGPTGPTGLTGELIVDLNRLAESDVLRQAVVDHPDADLVVLVSHALHDDVIRPGYLDAAAFTQVRVRAKEFAASAWLWIG